MFCKHNYSLVESIETKSEFEQVTEAGLRPNTHNSFSKKYIQIFKCEKCNKLKKMVTKV